MTDPLEVADLIDAGHDELLTHGWCQGEFENEAGKICSVRALTGAEAARGAYNSNRVLEAAKAIGVTIDGLLMGWNDTLGRTEDEVFDAFRQTSKRLREQAQ